MPVRFVHFALSEELSENLGGAITAIQQDTNKKQHALQLGAALQQFTHEAIEFFLFDISARIGLGPIAMKTVELGGATATKGFSLVIKRLITRLDDEQLQQVTEFLDEITVVK